MEKERRISWESMAIVIAILVLAGSIFAAGVKIANTVDTGIKGLKVEVREELIQEFKQDLRKEATALIYAYRSAALENRQINQKDLEEGYKFAEQFLSR